MTEHKRVLTAYFGDDVVAAVAALPTNADTITAHGKPACIVGACLIVGRVRYVGLGPITGHPSTDDLPPELVAVAYAWDMAIEDAIDTPAIDTIARDTRAAMLGGN